MSKRDFMIFISVAVLLVALLYMAKRSLKASYHEEIANLKKFEVEAKSLSRLKSTIGKEKRQRAISSLSRISTPTKEIKKGDGYLYIYENLSLGTLSALLRKIENSTLIIKSLKVVRESAKSATLRLEIGK